jgi:hypothetical protein
LLHIIIVREIISRAANSVDMGEMRNVYRIHIRKPERKSTLETCVDGRILLKNGSYENIM